jgi:hypothetical protein
MLRGPGSQRQVRSSIIPCTACLTH